MRMTGQADGTVYINSKIDTTGIKPGTKEIEISCRRAAKTVSEIGNSAKNSAKAIGSSFSEIGDSISKQEQKVESLKSELAKLSQQRVATDELKGLEKDLASAEKQLDKFYTNLRKIESSNGMTISSEIKKAKSEISELEKTIFQLRTQKDRLLQGDDRIPLLKNEIKEYEKQLDSLKDKLSQQESTNNKIKNSAPYKNAIAQIDIYNQKADELRGKLEVLQASGGAYRPVDTSEVEKKLGSEIMKLEEMRQKAAEAAAEAARLKEIGENAQISNQHIVDLNNELQRLKERQADLSKAGVGGLGFAEFEQNAARIAEIQQELRNYQSSLSEAEKTTTRFSDRLRKAFSGAVSVVKKTAGAMLLFHKNTKKSNGSIGSGIKNILKYAIGIRSLYVLFNKIRNAVKEGFKNLAQYSDEVNGSLSALKSSSTQLKNSLATAFSPILSVITPILVNFINLLSKAATYVGMFFAALTGKTSFTKAVAVQEDYAASLGDTAKNAKEAKKYLSGLDEVRTYTSDSDSSGGGAGGISPADMFEDVSIPDFINDWIKKFKEAWENADFTEIGTIVGTKLKNALDSIKWNEIYQTARNFGKGIATFLNGLISPGLFESVGNTIAGALNTALNFLNSFGENFDWKNFGKSLSRGLIGFLTTWDAGLTGETLSTFLKGIIESITSAINELASGDAFVTLGQKLVDFICGIDWAGLAWDLWGLFIAIANALIEFPLDLATGIAQGIMDRIMGAEGVEAETPGWIQAFADAFSFLTDTVIPDIQNAFVGFWKALEPIADFVGGVFRDVWEKLLSPALEKLSDDIIPTLEKTFENIWNNVLRPLFGYISAVATPIIRVLSDVLGILWRNVLLPLAQAIGSVVYTAFQNISKILNETVIPIAKKVIEVFTYLWENVFGPLITILWEKVKPAFENIFSTVKSVIGGIKEWLSGLINFIGGIFTGNWKQAWEGIKQAFSGIWSAIWSVIKGIINSIIGGINGMISAVVSGINVVIKALNKIHFDIPDWVPGFGGKSFGFSIPTITAPQIPYLATGAVIPPNAPFMAVLGDQKSGNNIETPENLLRKIVREESGQSGFNGTIRIPVIISGKQVFEAIISEAQLRQMMNGRNPFEMA